MAQWRRARLGGERLQVQVLLSRPSLGWPRGERYFGLCNPPTPKPGPEARLRRPAKAPGLGHRTRLRQVKILVGSERMTTGAGSERKIDG